jgi:hypothetical protein
MRPREPPISATSRQSSETAAPSGATVLTHSLRTVVTPKFGTSANLSVTNLKSDRYMPVKDDIADMNRNQPKASIALKMLRHMSNRHLQPQTRGPVRLEARRYVKSIQE